MTALAANLLALIIVLGLCWVAMMWLSGRFHGGHMIESSEFEFDTVEIDDDAHTIRRTRFDAEGAHDLPVDIKTEPPCMACEGVGATTTQGRLSPCSECFGTGVLS